MNEFTYFYLATSYRLFPAGRQAAHIFACILAARLIRAGVPVYSPIGCTHPIAEIGDFDPVDHELWMKVDEPMVRSAGGLIVAMSEDWEQSDGIAYEIRQFTLANKPIIYWDPATAIPAVLIDMAQKGANYGTYSKCGPANEGEVLTL